MPDLFQSLVVAMRLNQSLQLKIQFDCPEWLGKPYRWFQAAFLKMRQTF